MAIFRAACLGLMMVGGGEGCHLEVLEKGAPGGWRRKSACKSSPLTCNDLLPPPACFLPPCLGWGGGALRDIPTAHCRTEVIHVSLSLFHCQHACVETWLVSCQHVIFLALLQLREGGFAIAPLVLLRAASRFLMLSASLLMALESRGSIQVAPPPTLPRDSLKQLVPCVVIMSIKPSRERFRRGSSMARVCCFPSRCIQRPGSSGNQPL